MRNQIDFREARRGYVPTVGLDGDVMLEQIARFGAPVNPPPLLVLLRGQSTVHLPRTDREQLSPSPGLTGSACESTASKRAAAPSSAPTKDTRPPPTRWSGWTAVRVHSSVLAAVPSEPVVSRVAGHSKCEWRTFCGNRWLSKIRSASPVSPVDMLADTAHKWPGNTPTSLCAPFTLPKSSLTRVTS